MSEQEPYLPALRYRRLTPLYDSVVGVLLRERALKRRLVDQAAIGAGDRVLDVGCGTATLTLMVQAEVGDALVFGVDGDLETLALARRKAVAAGTRLRVCAALAQDLPFADGSFERVVSSLFFHHLTRASKLAALGAIRRVLVIRGELHVLDWGRAQDPLMRTLFLFVQLLDGFETTTDSVRGRLVEFLSDAEFDGVRETQRVRTLLGTLSLYEAVARENEARRELEMSIDENQEDER
ncbi:MAG: class I SAM-dependent methyltransferase [Thermoanaerobaculia bacterium]